MFANRCRFAPKQHLNQRLFIGRGYFATESFNTLTICLELEQKAAVTMGTLSRRPERSDTSLRFALQRELLSTTPPIRIEPRRIYSVVSRKRVGVLSQFTVKVL